MGFFGKDIMGGDLQMDMKFVILRAAGVRFKDYEPVGTKKQIAALLTKNQDKLLAKCQERAKKLQERERTIPARVLGTIMMNYGAKINETVMGAVQQACKDDYWAKASLERAIHVRQLAEILKVYDHKTPTEESIDYEKAFGVTSDDFLKRGFSSKMALMALHYVHHGYKHQPWYCNSTLVVNGGGYRVLIFTHVDKVNMQELIGGDESLFEIEFLYTDARVFNPEFKDEVEERIKNMPCILSNERIPKDQPA